MKNFAWLIFSLLLGACSLSQGSATPAVQPLDAPAITSLPQQSPASLLELSSPLLEGKNLSGRLVLIQYDPRGNILVEISFPGGEARTLFQSPEKAWLGAAAVSPDGDSILLSYAPPPVAGGIQLGMTGLYSIPYDGSGPPHPWMDPADPPETFFNPTWSPDGRYVYYSHLFPSDLDPSGYHYVIERMQFGGLPEVIVQNGMWPRLSPNGEKLAYLSVDPAGAENHLYLAGLDGTDPTRVLQPGAYPSVDAHLFLPDGQSILFSAVNPQPVPSGSWLDRLFGAVVASAHNAPSDWYQVTFPGWEPQRLTRLNDTGMFADISPGGDQVVFISATGLYLMNLDGSDLVQISTGMFIGTVDWIE